MLLLSAKGDVYQRDQKAQLQTWVAKAPERVRVLHLLGSSEGFNRIIEPNLLVDCEDSAILLKTIIGIQYCLDNFEFEYIVRSNTSTFFDPFWVESIVRGQPSTGFGGYWDLYGKSKEPFVTGTGLFISKFAANVLVNGLQSVNLDSIPDDVAISRILRSHKAINLFSIGRKSLSVSHIVTFHSYVRCKDASNPLKTAMRIKMYSDFYFSSGIKRILQFVKLQKWELSYFSFKRDGLFRFSSDIFHLFLQFWRNKKITSLIKDFDRK